MKSFFENLYWFFDSLFDVACSSASTPKGSFVEDDGPNRGLWDSTSTYHSSLGD